MNKLPLVVDGVRTPFMRSLDKFAGFTAHELATFALNGLINKTEISSTLVEYVCLGTVIADPNTSNIAREAVLSSVLNKTTPAHSVSMACISSNASTTTIMDLILTSRIECGIAGGVETFSDVPLRFSRNLRRMLLQSTKKKHLTDRLKLWSNFRLRDLKPEIPSPKEFSTGKTMGEAGDELAALFAISRKDADTYALLSHERAHKAWQLGHYQKQVIAVDVPPSFTAIERDDGPRVSTFEKVSSLSPAFNKYGINTAANSSFFSDGASAIMLATDEFCRQHDLTPLARIKDYFYTAGDPQNELLLGPALSVPILLKKNNLSVNDIDVFEVHEAFAGQVLANLKAMASAKFCRERLGLSQAMGEIPFDRMNLWGGSLSLGHPFGATGARLIHTAALRLQHEKSRYAIVTGCAASGLGSAILLERA